MTAAELVAALRTKGVSLAVKDGKLRLESPPGAITAVDRAELKAAWKEIVVLLSPPASGDKTPSGRPPAGDITPPASATAAGRGRGGREHARPAGGDGDKTRRGRDAAGSGGLMSPVAVARVLAALADAGRHPVRGSGGLAISDGPGTVTEDLRRQVERHQPEFIDFLGRDRFTKAELDALGFRGTKCADGRGMFEVRVGGAIEILILRLGLFDVVPEIRGDELWLAGEDDPETVLPQKLLALARARAAEIYEFLRAKEARDA